MSKQRRDVEKGAEAADVEVSAGELASALAAIEGRREAATRKDTIAIGDAISQLGFDVSPEEIAAEVEWQKQARGAAERLARERRSRWQRWLFAGVLVFSLGLNLKLLTSRGAVTDSAIQGEAAIFEQSGRFHSIAGREGVVRFPLPYRAIPNLEMKNHPNLNKTVVTETMSWGFRWKNTGPDDLFNNGSIEWTARGAR